MNSEEIKESVNMSDVLSDYDIPVIRGMCRCPFHDDKKPSMKVYRDGVRCFTCGESWDVFGFVMKMDDCDFKTAFRKLGGSYEHDSGRERIITQARIAAEKAKRNRVYIVNKTLFREAAKALMLCQLADKIYEPLSDEWCYLKNELPIIEFIFEERFIYGDQIPEIGDVDVHRKCRQIINRCLP